MKHTFEEVAETLGRVAKINRAWHTRDIETAKGTFAAGSTTDLMRMNEEPSQEVAQMKLN